METPAVIQYLTGFLQVPPPYPRFIPRKSCFSLFFVLISFSLCIYFPVFVIGHHSTIAWLIVPLTFCRCSTHSSVFSAVFFLSLLYSCTTFNLSRFHILINFCHKGFTFLCVPCISLS